MGRAASSGARGRAGRRISRYPARRSVRGAFRSGGRSAPRSRRTPADRRPSGGSGGNRIRWWLVPACSPMEFTYSLGTSLFDGGGRLGDGVLTGFDEQVVLAHEIAKDGVAQEMIAGRGEMDMIVLRHSGQHPLPHGSLAAHFRAEIPKRAAGGGGGLALRFDNHVDLVHGDPAPAGVDIAVRRADDENGGGGGGVANPADQLLEHPAIGFKRPRLLSGFIGPVGEHDQRRIAARDIRFEHRLIPIELVGRLRAVDAEGLIGHAGGIFGDPSEQSYGGAVERLHFEFVGAGRGVVMKISGLLLAAGGDSFDQRAVIVDLNRAAAGLLKIEKFEGLALGLKIDGLARRFGGHADAAEPVNAVAGAADQSIGMPALGGSRAHILTPVTVPRASGEGVSAAAIAEFFLEAGAEVAGPLVGGGVRIAVMKDAHRPGELALLMTIEQFEERHQRGGVFDRNFGAIGDVRKYALVRFRADFRADKRSLRDYAANSSEGGLARCRRSPGRARSIFLFAGHFRFGIGGDGCEDGGAGERG